MKKPIRKTETLLSVVIFLIVRSLHSRYCLANGYYTLNLQDMELWETRKKHAKVVFSSGSANATLEGTVQVMNFPVGVPWKSNKNSDNDDTPVTETVGFIVGITVACVVTAVLVGFAL